MSMVPGEAPPPALPIRIGVLYDFPQADGGASVEEALRLGFAEVAAAGRIDRDFELVSRQARGLPGGTAHDMERNYADLVDAGVLAVVGPSISDNGLIVAPMADAAGVPTVNYTGGEQTRSEFMFHYQVGSLQEEPVVLVEHLARRGVGSVAAAYDNSPVGRGYAESLAQACGRAGIDVTGSAAVPALSEDVSPVVRRLRAGEPESLVYLGLGVAARALAVALEAEGWPVPVVANSSLMFGYTRRDWRAGWEGWVYVDGVSDENAARAALAAHAPKTARGPVGVAAYDIGRLIAEGVARSAHLTRKGLKEGLELVKRIPAATGMDGTTMGFGTFDRGALKGRYLVLRRWEAGKTVQVEDQ
ncbi:MAG TPA: ABC transporter substrate-binding protein [Acidimicrobiales bacterium]|nr:ABC transporter substrate-binding protein [Acidimicrobiales bacterium]